MLPLLCVGSSTPSKCEAFWITLNTKKEKLGQRDVSKATGVSSQLNASSVDPMGTRQLHMLPLVQQRKKVGGCSNSKGAMDVARFLCGTLM